MSLIFVCFFGGWLTATSELGITPLLATVTLMHPGPSKCAAFGHTLAWTVLHKWQGSYAHPIASDQVCVAVLPVMMFAFPHSPGGLAAGGHGGTLYYCGRLLFPQDYYSFISLIPHRTLPLVPSLPTFFTIVSHRVHPHCSP